MAGTNTTSPPKPAAARRRWARWLLVPAVLLLIGGGVLTWRLWPRSYSYYTDADQIREPMDAANPRDVLWQPPVPLSEPINSSTDDYEPRLSADGMTLFFVRGKAGENADIYVSRRIPKFSRDLTRSADSGELEGWSSPQPLTELNSPEDDLGPEPSPDGRSIYFYSNRAGGLGGYDLWVAHLGEQGWLAPVNLGPRVNSPFNDYGPALTPDGGTLFFATNRPQPQDPERPGEDAWPATIREDLFKRDYDLFASAIMDSGVGAAAPLAALNTPSNEGSPAVSPAGDFLYFASDRPGGHGGFDLYRARRVRGAVQPPANLGAGVNTPANEMDPALALGGFGLHFSSDRAGKKSISADRPDYDIYQTTSREVFTEEEVQHASIDWAGLWSQIGPSLLWALLSLLLLLLLLRLLGGLRSRELSLLVRCLLASVFLHLLLLFLLSFWEVTASIAGAIQRRGGIKIALVAPAHADSIESQILGSVTEVRIESINTAVAQAAPTPLPMESPDHLATFEPRPSPTESEARPLLEHQVADAIPREFRIQNSRMEQTPITPPSVALTLPSEPQPRAEASEQQVAPPAAVAQSPTQAAHEVPAPSESAFSELSRIDPTQFAPPSDASESLARQDRPAQDAPLPTEFRIQNSEFKKADEAPPATNLALSMPAASDQPVAVPEQAAPRPEPAAVEITQAPAATSVANAATADLSRIEPGPSEPAAHTDVSFAQTETAPTDATTAEFRVQNSEFQNPEPTAPPELTLAIPSATSQVLADRPEDAAPPLPPSAAAQSTPAELVNLPSPTATEQVTVAPKAVTPRRAADASLAVTTDDPSDSSIDPAAVVTAPAEPADTIPEALALSLRLPTEIAPPENPYVQRQVEQKTELLKRLGGSDETERAVAAALKWLATHQGRAGQWDGDGFDSRCGECGGETDLQVDVGLTGLALLCYLGANHTHVQDGPYRDHVDRGITWLLGVQASDGDLRADETMYSHGLAAIALSEAYGMTRDPKLAGPVEQAIRFIERARNRRVGGWRYDPGQAGDTSMLGWQVMALKSAQMAEILVDAESFAAAGDWLEKVSHPSRPGQYAYQPQRRPSHGMTAEGMFVQQLLGRHSDEPRMRASAEFISERLPDWNAALDTYYWYYATLALFQHQGEIWEQWNRALTRELLANQRSKGRAAGSWDPRGRWADKGGRVYQTALCTLMLEVYYRYLPLYQTPPVVSP